MPYTIKSISRLCGISVDTLRNWERRYGFPKPGRGSNGYRTYSRDQLELLRIAAERIAAGERAGDVLPDLGRERTPTSSTEDDDVRWAEKVSAEIFEALAKRDLGRAETLVVLAGSRLSVPQLVDLVFAPVLARASKSGATDDERIEHEYFISTFIRMRMIGLFHEVAPSKEPRSRIILVTPPGELHELGLLTLAIHLKLRGAQVFYLGHGVPFHDLRVFATEVRPDAIGLSLSDPSNVGPVMDALRGVEFNTCLGGNALRAMASGAKAGSGRIYLCDRAGMGAIEFLELVASEKVGRGSAPRYAGE